MSIPHYWKYCDTNVVACFELSEWKLPHMVSLKLMSPRQRWQTMDKCRTALPGWQPWEISQHASECVQIGDVNGNKDWKLSLCSCQECPLKMHSQANDVNNWGLRVPPTMLLEFFDHQTRSNSNHCWHPRCRQHVPSGGENRAIKCIRLEAKRLPQAVWTGMSFQLLMPAFLVVHSTMAWCTKRCRPIAKTWSGLGWGWGFAVSNESEDPEELDEAHLWSQKCGWFHIPM